MTPRKKIFGRARFLGQKGPKNRNFEKSFFTPKDGLISSLCSKIQLPSLYRFLKFAKDGQIWPPENNFSVIFSVKKGVKVKISKNRLTRLKMLILVPFVPSFSLVTLRGAERSLRTEKIWPKMRDFRDFWRFLGYKGVQKCEFRKILFQAWWWSYKHPSYQISGF